MKVPLLFLAAFGAAGCTALRPATLSPGPSDAAPVAVGDHVRAINQNGEVMRFDVTELTSTSLEGTSRSGQSVAIEIEDLTKLEVRRSAPGRTGALVGALLFGVWGLEYVEDNVAFFP